MIADKLPAVLQQPRGNSISLERALKQIKALLELGDFPEVLPDTILASIDDCEVMLANLDRS